MSPRGSSVNAGRVASGPSSSQALAAAVFGMAVLIVATILAAIDRQILVLLADPIRRSLALSDTHLGLLNGVGLTLFGGIAAVPLAWLADRFGRRLVLAACVLLWTGATAASALASDFNHLLAAAIGLGIGEAGLAPIVYALIPEIVPPSRRALANGIYAVTAILGAGLGIALSGELIAFSNGLRNGLPLAMRDLEAWRLAFLTVAVPGPVVALLILLIRLRPDLPATAASGRAAHNGLGAYLRQHAGTVSSVFIGIGMANLGIAALGAWAPVIATRTFGASVQAVGRGIGAAYMIGTVSGALVGGAGMRWLQPRLGPATSLRVISIGLALTAGVAALLPLSTSALHVYVLFGLQVAFLISATVVIPTMLQDMAPEPLRTRVIALATMVSVMLSSLSPVMVGLASDLLRRPADGLILSVAAVAATSMAFGALLTRMTERRFVRTVAGVAASADDPAFPAAGGPVVSASVHPAA